MPAFKKGARELLSQLAFWVILAYFVLAATDAGLFHLYSKQANEAASRAATAKASATTQVSQCFVSVKNAPITDGFIDAHSAIIENGILANRAALDLAPANDPLRQVRLRSIARLERAQSNVKQLRHLFKKTTPTRAKCVDLAASLHVDATRFEGK